MKKTSRKARFSPQREKIKEIVLESNGHFSVDQIFTFTKESFPKISRATVYRNLHHLEKGKHIMSMIAKDQIHYEKAQKPHHHFICNKCELIENLHSPSVEVCTGCIKNTLAHQIDSVLTTIYGICEGCLG
jgi:Fur family peroxide stress response transcriptional regulator